MYGAGKTNRFGEKRGHRLPGKGSLKKDNTEGKPQFSGEEPSGESTWGGGKLYPMPKEHWGGAKTH